MTVMDATTDTSVHHLSADGDAQRARRRGPRRLDANGTVPLEAQTIKAYRLGDEARRTVGYLRRIVNQRRIPDEARLTIEGECLTIEWADE